MCDRERQDNWKPGKAFHFYDPVTEEIGLGSKIPWHQTGIP
jgi:hypothetical protein